MSRLVGCHPLKEERRASSKGTRRSVESYGTVPLLLDDPQDVVGVKYQVVIAVEDDLGPRVLGEDYDVPLADLDLVAIT